MDTRIGGIVVGIADTLELDPLLAPAIELAESLGAALHIVHTFYLPEPMGYVYPDINAQNPELMRQYTEAMLGQLEAQVRKISASARLHTRALPGPADVAVLEVAEEVGADLIMVGATRRGAISRKFLGTTAQRVARAATTPVLVVRRPGSEPPRRVLVPTDLSDLSERVIQRGLGLVDILTAGWGVELRALLAIGHDVPVSAPLVQHDREDVGREQLDAFLDRSASGVRIADRKVRRGEPAPEIVDEAESWNADLVVMGTHGRTGPSRFLIGSVAEGVLGRAACDVLVIPVAAVSGGGAVHDR